MALDFHAAAVRFGQVGVLRFAALGSPEPADVDDLWDPAYWYTAGYTDTGSAFNYSIKQDVVDVAEELDVFARVTTGRDASVEVALAEVTYRNLQVAFNGGILEDEFSGTSFSFEPPDLGDEVPIMLGWDANKVTANNDMRFLFRQAKNGGSLGIDNRKGNVKRTLSMNFGLEKPLSGLKILKLWGASTLNPSTVSTPTLATLSPATGAQSAAVNVTLTGTGFEPLPVVTVSGTGVTVSSTTYVSATSITATFTQSGSATLGARSVTVTNADGGAVTKANAYTVTA